MSIAAQEKVKLDKNELDELIELSGTLHKFIFFIF